MKGVNNESIIIKSIATSCYFIIIMGKRPYKKEKSKSSNSKKLLWSKSAHINPINPQIEKNPKEKFYFFTLSLKNTIISIQQLKLKDFILILTLDRIVTLSPSFICLSTFWDENIYQIKELSNGYLAISNRYYFILCIISEEGVIKPIEKKVFDCPKTHSVGIYEVEKNKFTEIRAEGIIRYEKKKGIEIIQESNEFCEGCHGFTYACPLNDKKRCLLMRRSNVMIYHLERNEKITSISLNKENEAILYKPVLLDQNDKNFLLYCNEHCTVYNFETLEQRYQVKPQEQIYFVKKLNYSTYIGVSEKKGVVQIIQLENEKYYNIYTFSLSKTGIFTLHELLDNKIIFNINKKKLVVINYINGKQIYTESSPSIQDYRKGILLKDGRYLLGNFKGFLCVK